MQTIHIGSDHAGVELRQFLARELRNLGYTVEDHGCDGSASCDYALIAHPLCEKVLAQKDLGILICGTGLGMSMAANRHPGIRAALCCVETMARLAREHNNANILCLGARIIGRELALAIAKEFLSGKFAHDRHERRIAQIEIS